MALVAAGIPFRIVPGITAGIGGLAYAGIPVTHRDTNSAVTFVTGHNSTGAVPDGLDWERDRPRRAGARAVHGAKASAADRRAAAGRRPAAGDEPAAIVSKASTPEQQVLVSHLEADRRRFRRRRNAGDRRRRRGRAAACRARLARCARRTTARSRSARPRGVGADLVASYRRRADRSSRAARGLSILTFPHRITRAGFCCGAPGGDGVPAPKGYQAVALSWSRADGD